jgi:DNA repair exonuclease SbcCD ATPase subunit
MISIFQDKKTDEKLNKLNSVLNNSFNGVKKDISNIFNWINYLYNKSNDQEKLIVDLKNQLHYLPKNKEELRHLIDEFYEINNLKTNIEKITLKLETIEDSNKALSSLAYKVEQLKENMQNIDSNMLSTENIIPRIKKIVTQIEELDNAYRPLKNELEDQKIRLDRYEKIKEDTPVQKINLREKLLRKMAKTSKDHVKNLINSIIMKYGQVSAMQIREIIVEEQGLVSKSSFYRILEEVEKDSNITVIHDKKEKKFIYNVKNLS